MDLSHLTDEDMLIIDMYTACEMKGPDNTYTEPNIMRLVEYVWAHNSEGAKMIFLKIEENAFSKPQPYLYIHCELYCCPGYTLSKMKEFDKSVCQLLSQSKSFQACGIGAWKLVPNVNYKK